MSYCTYLVGKQAYFDAVLLDELQSTTHRLFPTPYRSIWRMLHIDGFEPGLPSLPVSQGYQIQFFATDAGSTPASPEPGYLPTEFDCCNRCGTPRWAHDESAPDVCVEFKE